MMDGTAKAVARAIAGPVLLCAIVIGLFAMHGIQPTPGPVRMPGVLTLHDGGTMTSGREMAVVGAHSPTKAGARDGQMPGHGGHGGGEVCLALLLAGLLVFFVGGALGACLSVQAAVGGGVVPRAGPRVLPRGPTLARLCVLRR
ncbi:DUF6153 family protein [Sphaerisporangium krabiense]|uniref:Uncharacterized protein n=2 Tax=Sphaerisporangium krabiense TaxID=763782 RepID=A0A7W9DNM6_9ACTN|nr:DUF6153 family protein [Sphaerisporangium krabiense]MBB5625611.1 hypothetical protein [Sphaerisporangium krabiense]